MVKSEKSLLKKMPPKTSYPDSSWTPSEIVLLCIVIGQVGVASPSLHARFIPSVVAGAAGLTEVEVTAPRPHVLPTSSISPQRGGRDGRVNI